MAIEPTAIFTQLILPSAEKGWIVFHILYFLLTKCGHCFTTRFQ
jgi:hypothetical protein